MAAAVSSDDVPEHLSRLYLSQQELLHLNNALASATDCKEIRERAQRKLGGSQLDPSIAFEGFVVVVWSRPALGAALTAHVLQIASVEGPSDPTKKELMVTMKQTGEGEKVVRVSSSCLGTAPTLESHLLCKACWFHEQGIIPIIFTEEYKRKAEVFRSLIPLTTSLDKLPTPEKQSKRSSSKQKQQPTETSPRGQCASAAVSRKRPGAEDTRSEQQPLSPAAPKKAKEQDRRSSQAGQSNKRGKELEDRPKSVTRKRPTPVVEPPVAHENDNLAVGLDDACNEASDEHPPAHQEHSSAHLKRPTDPRQPAIASSALSPRQPYKSKQLVESPNNVLSLGSVERQRPVVLGASDRYRSQFEIPFGCQANAYHPHVPPLPIKPCTSSKCVCQLASRGHGTHMVGNLNITYSYRPLGCTGQIQGNWQACVHAWESDLLDLNHVAGTPRSLVWLSDSFKNQAGFEHLNGQDLNLSLTLSKPALDAAVFNGHMLNYSGQIAVLCETGNEGAPGIKPYLEYLRAQELIQGGPCLGAGEVMVCHQSLGPLSLKVDVFGDSSPYVNVLLKHMPPQVQQLVRRGEALLALMRVRKHHTQPAAATARAC